jgi:uncharacterized protein YfiM (DUF2279 family)
MHRMNREQFFAAMAGLDEDQLRKALWTLYWRGSAAIRERIEAELAPGDARSRSRDVAPSADPREVLDEVREFVSLARSGSYMAGDRRVSPRERTRWRFTFKRLMTQSRQALLADEIASGAAAVAAMIDLACECRDYDYFHSDDPVEAAGLVVSDEVALLWDRTLRRSGFPVFAKDAAEQLLRWESRFGWTRRGFGRVGEKEAPLADVLARMLPVHDAWITVTDCYLSALDQVVSAPAGSNRSWRTASRRRDGRTQELARWHLLLLDRFADDTDAAGLLDRLVAHPGLGGPELTFLRAMLAHRRGDTDHARSLVHDSLRTLPGHQGFLDFAHEIGAPLPPRARQIAEERLRWDPTGTGVRGGT